ncbi:MAG: type II toxin-antitoxin system VapC family toxin [Deltaproteobacteria bacterium]|nr:type II toxin-antitoxin system VapC family toxin [Deltaproteobacteria bacterium]
MKILLDTHIFIWWIHDNAQLSKKARAYIENENNDLFLSIASVWELSIKLALGKIELYQDLEFLISEELEKNNIDLLPIKLKHALHVNKLAHYHRDPFDRMLVSQALVEGIPLLSDDSLFKKYAVELLY